MLAPARLTRVWSVAAALLFVLVLATSTHADDYVWNVKGGKAGNWFNVNNWTPNTVPNTNTANTVFDGPATVNVNGSPTINAMHFNTGGAITITTAVPDGITLGGTKSAIEMNSSDDVTLTGGGSANLVFTLESDITFGGSGTGTLRIGGDTDEPVIAGGSGRNITFAFGTTGTHANPNLLLGNLGTHNSYQGSLTMTSGYVRVSRGASDDGVDIIDGASLLTIDGGTFDLDGNFENIAGLKGNGGNLHLSGPGNGTGGIRLLTGGNRTYAGVISGSGSVEQAGGDIFFLTGSNTYTGQTRVTDGTISVGNGGATGSIASDEVVVSSGAFFRFFRSNSYTYSGVISGAGTVTQQGTGTTTLTGANTYTGNTRVFGGTLQMGASGALSGSSALIIGNSAGADGAVFDKNGFSNTVPSLTIVAPAGGYATVVTGPGTLTLTGNVAIQDNTAAPGDGWGATIAGGTLDLGGATRTLNVAGQNLVDHDELTIGSAITNGGLTVNATRSGVAGAPAAGVVLTSAGNTYALGTTIASGFLTVAPGSSLGTGPVTLTTGTDESRLVVQGALTVNGLSTGTLGDGVARVSLQSGANLTTSHTGTRTYAGVITGPGSLAKAGTGVFILTGDNTYSGGTVISAGTLRANGQMGTESGTGTGTVTVNGGTLAGTGRVAGAVTVNPGGAIRGGATGTGTLTLGDNLAFKGSAASNPILRFEASRTGGNGTVGTADASLISLPGASSVLNLDLDGNRLTIAVVNGTNPLQLGESYRITLATVGTSGNIQLNGSGLAANTAIDPSNYVLDTSAYPGFTDVSLRIDGTGRSLVLTFTPVPEPTTVLGIGAFGGLVLSRIARRRRAV